MTINQTTMPVKMDVCEFLSANPALKAVVEAAVEECAKEEARDPIEENDVIRATMPLPIAAGELLNAAGRVYYDDWVESRVELHIWALRLAARALRYYANIGNLKGRER